MDRLIFRVFWHFIWLLAEAIDGMSGRVNFARLSSSEVQ